MTMLCAIIRAVRMPSNLVKFRVFPLGLGQLAFQKLLQVERRRDRERKEDAR